MPMHHNSEKSYSAPFSSHLYSKETVKQGSDSEIRVYPDLLYKGNHNKFSDDKTYNISITLTISFIKSFFICFLIYMLIFYRTLFENYVSFSKSLLTQERKREYIYS